MSHTQLVKSMLENRCLDEITIFSTVINLTFCLSESLPGTIPVYELHVYSPIKILGAPKGSRFEWLKTTELGSTRAVSAACASLVVAAKVTSASVDSTGNIDIHFENEFAIRVCGRGTERECSWVITEPTYSERLPRTELQCSNSGCIEEFTIG